MRYFYKSSRNLKSFVLIGILSGLVSSGGLANTDLTQPVSPQYIIKSDMTKSLKPTMAPAGLQPAQVKVAYGFNKIPFEGAGQTIAIVTAYDAPTAEVDLAVFNQTFSLPACTTENGCFKKIFANGPTPAGDKSWALASNLAVQWAHAMAPKAKLLLIESINHYYGNIMTGVHQALMYGATIVAMAWGSEEIYNEANYDMMFSNPAITFIAGVGDTGTGTLYPAVSPHVIAVGGTSLSIDANGNYLSETAWNSTGGGLSLYEKAPAHQSSFSLPNNPNQMRGIPDVSYHADPNKGYAVFSSYGYPGWMVVGGTGIAVAQWAAIIADIKSSTTKPLSGFNKLLYATRLQPNSTAYRDITSGSNGSCGYFCTAQPGYDYVTGLGTPRVDNLTAAILNM